MTGPVGLVHDYLLVLRGAERAFAAIAECWPDAPIYTTLYRADGTAGVFEGREVVTSSLQRLHVGQRTFRALLPLYPRAVERLPVQRHRLIVSSSSAFAHGIRPGPGAIHVCYCHSPFRYAWQERQVAELAVPAIARPPLRLMLKRARRWDLAAASRVTHYIAVSESTRERVRRLYGREASVVHPPVAVERFSSAEPEDYFLVVTELVPHKRVHVALEGARRAGRRVVVVGGGGAARSLRSEFSDIAEFVGRVSDRRLAELYARARALLVPSTEEFGIAAVEAQAAGRPVLAIGRGGALETVLDGETGVLLPRGDADEFAEALREVDFGRFSSELAIRNASRFATARFKQRLRSEVARLAGTTA